MNSITITLPLPVKELSPNAREHWAVKAKAKKVARNTAWAATKELLNGRRPLWVNAMSKCVFYFKTSAKHDSDNALSSCKALFDGIVDAGLLMDDVGLGHYPVEIRKDAKNPRVEITITEEK